MNLSQQSLSQLLRSLSAENTPPVFHRKVELQSNSPDSPPNRSLFEELSFASLPSSSSSSSLHTARPSPEPNLRDMATYQGTGPDFRLCGQFSGKDGQSA